MNINETHLKMKARNRIIYEQIGFGNHILVKNIPKQGAERHKILRFIKSVSLSFERLNISDSFLRIVVNDSAKEKVIFSFENGNYLVNVSVGFLNKKGDFLSQRNFIEKMISKIPIVESKTKGKFKSISTKKRIESKILLFKNLMNSPDKENCNYFSPGTLQLASALKMENVPFIISDSKISLKDDEYISNINKMKNILEKTPDINLVAITLCENYFFKAKELIRFIKERTRAFIVVGGPMPTLTPEHVFVHMPQVNFVVRGEGEEILPQLAKILSGKFTDSELNDEIVRQILNLQGLLFTNGKIMISSKINKINKIKDYDKVFLKFDLLEKEDVTNGLNLFTSRGCRNNCIFCTTIGKGEFNARSFESMKDILKRYSKRLEEIFNGQEIPPNAFKLSFNDDDFLGNPERAIKFFNYIKNTPFYIDFFQTGINSFFIHKNGKTRSKLNYSLLESISRDIFISKDLNLIPNENNIYIGTENFSDEELNRLGKGYKYEKIEMVVRELSKKKILQTHHLILSNAETNLGNICENLIRIAKLRGKYGKYFKILYPTVTNLLSFYPSRSYGNLIDKNLTSALVKCGELKIKEFPEFNYPLIEKDRPISKNASDICDKFLKFQNRKDDYFKLLDNALFFLLFRAENLSLKEDEESNKLSSEIYKIIYKYHDYPKIIYEEELSGTPLENNKSNIQVMVTRKCQLRCRYCPVLKSGENMEEEILSRSVEFLFESSKKNLRLDFAGGEPMLVFDNVEKAVQSAKKIAEKKDKKISFYMITNSIALNKDISEFLKREEFQLELSIDGYEHINNLNKIPLEENLNHYKILTKNLQLLNDVDKNAVMVTTPQTVNKLFDCFKNVVTLGFKNIGINYALGIFWDNDSIKTLFKELNKIKEYFYSDIKNGKIKLENLSTRLEPAILNSEIMVDTDGQVHLLPEWIFDSNLKSEDQLALGNVKDMKFKNIFLSRFYSYYIIHKAYTQNNAKLKKIVINNILLGIKINKFFRRFFNDVN